ncbi:TPA: hypothetical protein ACH3X2_010852 [Trebouxia sp. C0005]
MKEALTSFLALLLGIVCAYLALVLHICSQLQKAALQLLWSWTPGWIQTTYTILAYVWYNTGKEGPTDAPPGAASFEFGFGKFVVTIVRRAKPSPSPSGTVVPTEGALDPVPARDTYGNDKSRDQHKSGVPDTHSAGNDGSQEATKVASEVKAQKDADNAHAVPIEVPDTRTSAVPQEVPDTMTNAAPGACTEIAQGSSGSPMRVPGRGLRATSGKLVLGLFQFMEGAQQRKPAFGFTTPAVDMVSPFWDVAERQQLGDVEPCSLSQSDRPSVSKLRNRVQSKAALAAAMQVDFPCSHKHSSKMCRHKRKFTKMHNLAHQATRRAGMSCGR